MRNFALALDLIDDNALIEEYVEFHQEVWPEILESIRNSGIVNMEIFRAGTRLFMHMAVSDDFSFEDKAKADAANPKVQEWEKLMWKYQQAIPSARPGEKWVLMDSIFKITS